MEQARVRRREQVPTPVRWTLQFGNASSGRLLELAGGDVIQRVGPADRRPHPLSVAQRSKDPSAGFGATRLMLNRLIAVRPSLLKDYRLYGPGSASLLELADEP